MLKAVIFLAVVLTALALIGIALLGPRTGEREVVVSTTGTDVVLLFDLSRSMDARDVPPSRLTRARAGAEADVVEVAARRHHDRLAAVRRVGTVQVRVDVAAGADGEAPSVEPHHHRQGGRRRSVGNPHV